jgi:hypothetical protein
VSVWVLIQRLLRHCRTRKTVVAMILGACVLEAAFFWVVPFECAIASGERAAKEVLRHL